MARAKIRVNTADAMYLNTTPAKPKVRNRETGELATHLETGETLFEVGLVQIVDGRHEVLQVIVPESRIPEGLTPGMAVMPVELVATPWAMKGLGDQIQEGITYRADGLELVK